MRINTLEYAILTQRLRSMAKSCRTVDRIDVGYDLITGDSMADLLQEAVRGIETLFEIATSAPPEETKPPPPPRPLPDAPDTSAVENDPRPWKWWTKGT